MYRSNKAEGNCQRERKKLLWYYLDFMYCLNRVSINKTDVFYTVHTTEWMHEFKIWIIFCDGNLWTCKMHTKSILCWMQRPANQIQLSFSTTPPTLEIIKVYSFLAGHNRSNLFAFSVIFSLRITPTNDSRLQLRIESQQTNRPTSFFRTTLMC